MLTAAGVSATDGNHNLPSGLWEEFREQLRDHYESADKLSTGWVSHTFFESHVGERIFHKMLSEYPNIRLLPGYHTENALFEENKVHDLSSINSLFQLSSKKSPLIRGDLEGCLSYFSTS